MVSSDSPVTNVSDPDLACGLGATDAALDAPVFPGSSINLTTVNVHSALAAKWPHEVGPVLTYMASCGTNASTCAGFNASVAEWFKIAEDARQRSPENASWVQELIMEGDAYNVTIPAGLKPGAYLIRNELIGLQNAMAPGGAEFFPSCTQLRILGNGTEVPAPNNTVRLPGAYNVSDPGILFDAYTDPDKPYVIPGPRIATFVNVTSPDEANGTSISSSVSGSPPPPASPSDKADDALPAPVPPSPSLNYPPPSSAPTSLHTPSQDPASTTPTVSSTILTSESAPTPTGEAPLVPLPGPAQGP
ncbi:hypothetical protein EVJ58_g6952 [Rhodofomes roseus]|uniref:lytic cellulose monooxygenase (C4-dehydrogenating) n=1 Tax=Rhodofomes roseus TaxID=34475 RepID=A0A4Y9Y5D0_9APHY|nr:hypothetical protein EVJ58_g6952 [Rhodofomes roseus]